MEKVNQNSNSIIEVANDNKANKPEHVIKAEISVDIIGEDEPTKYTKRRERWAVVAVWSLLALAVSSLYFIFVEMNVYSFFALVISVAICAFLFVKASDIDPEEPTGPEPWWYGAV